MEFKIYYIEECKVVDIIASFVYLLSSYCNILQITCAQLIEIKLYYLVLVKLVENEQMALSYSSKETANNTNNASTCN